METEGAFCQTGYCSYFANAFMRELSKDKDINWKLNPKFWKPSIQIASKLFCYTQQSRDLIIEKVSLETGDTERNR